MLNFLLGNWKKKMFLSVDQITTEVIQDSGKMFLSHILIYILYFKCRRITTALMLYLP